MVCFGRSSDVVVRGCMMFSAEGENHNWRQLQVICTHLPTWATIHKYYSTSSTSSYVRKAKMLAANKNDTTLSGPKMGKCRCRACDMSPTCRPTQHLGPKIGRHDIQQTQLSFRCNTLFMLYFYFCHFCCHIYCSTSLAYVVFCCTSLQFLEGFNLRHSIDGVYFILSKNQ